MIRHLDNYSLTVESQQNLGASVIWGQLAERPATQCLSPGVDRELFLIHNEHGVDDVIGGGNAKRTPV